MDVKRNGVEWRMTLLLMLFSAIFPLSYSKANRILDTNKPNSPSPANSSASTFVFPIQGNVYPLGHYTVSLSMGNPPRAYELDIDSGSDLTWVECDAPCTQCSLPKDRQFKLTHSIPVPCNGPLCLAVKHDCDEGPQHCHYQINYADNGPTLGLLIRDSFTLRLLNGQTMSTRLAFGCGYDQIYSGDHVIKNLAGVLGLGNGPTSIVSQLRSSGQIRNVVGHCLSAKGGYIFLGDGLTQYKGLVWTPILPTSSPQEHYASGPADLLSNGNPTPVVKGLSVTFDSGSTYTYLSAKAYKAVLDQISNDLKGKPLTRVAFEQDKTQPICWKGSNPLSYFKTLTLSFTNSKSQLQLPPQAYLIISNLGNACLGILDGSVVGLGDTNIIGDISLQGQLVIYDNEKRQVGWVATNCDQLPKL